MQHALLDSARFGWSCLAFSALTVSLITLSGCKFVGVDYEEPEVVMPDAWHQQLMVGTSKARLEIDYWWKQFNDPTLNELIDEAVAANLDLAIAYERVMQAREARRSTRSGLFPSVDATGSLNRQRTSETIGIAREAGGGKSESFYAAGLDVAWELDVLGGVRRSIEASDASLQATEESYRDFMVLLLSEVATNYIDVRTVEERIKLAKANIENQEESLALAQDRFDAGLVPRLDITQAETNLANTQALLPQLRQTRTAEVNRLATLIGGYSPKVEALIAKSKPIPIPPSRAGVGLPTEVIRLRPDIRAAERGLAAQTARIGVAEADLYPRFTLNGTFNLLSTSSGDVFDSDSRDYGFGPALRWNIFSAGRVRSQIAIEESRTREAYYAYENAVLLAVEEVEISMSDIANNRDRVDALERGADSARETVSLVKDNYQRGLVDFQNVLDAERTLTTTEDDRARSQGDISISYINLFKALGGGFPMDQPITRADETAEDGAEEASESNES